MTIEVSTAIIAPYLGDSCKSMNMGGFTVKPFDLTTIDGNWTHTNADGDKWEQSWILAFTKKGYQCRYNKTAGGQGEGKEKINEFKPAKGYRDGIQQGKKVLARELSSIAEKHLKIELREDKVNNKVSQKQYEKFMSLISEDSYENRTD